MRKLHGTMLRNVWMHGTSLRLRLGDKVALTPASNIPNGGGRFYARPYSGEWADGIERPDEDSILLDPGDVSDVSRDTDSIEVSLTQRPVLTRDNRVEIETDRARLVIKVDDTTEISLPLDGDDKPGSLYPKSYDVRLYRDGRWFEYSRSHYGDSYALLLALAEAHGVRIMNPDGIA